jgi:DNA-binding NarL/FixJ family response regulator
MSGNARFSRDCDRNLPARTRRTGGVRVKPLHVIVCEGRRIVRESLAGYLRAQPAVAATHAAETADEAIALARRGADVLVLDLDLGVGLGSGIDVLEALHNLHVRIPVLVVSDSADLDVVARALSLGALGFCPPTTRPAELYDAVVEVAAGKAVLPEALVVPLVQKLREDQRLADESSALLARLTARERDVLRLLAQGLNRAEIARRLNLSSNTARTHVRNLMEKLEVNTQLAAAARARELFDAIHRPTVALTTASVATVKAAPGR